MGLKSRRVGAGDPEVMLDINTTPLIDVMLVLLVMLIITIPIQLHAVKLEMPVGVPPDSTIKPDKVQIGIDARSVIHWNGLPVTAEELDRKMSLVAQQPVRPEIHLRPDKDARYAAFAQVLSATKRHGLDKVAVIGSEQFAR
jgi:biopolymer transport protein ExbD